MKITLEPTEEHRDIPYTTVILSQPSDDLPFAEALELVARALKAWGYPPELVDEAIPPM